MNNLSLFLLGLVLIYMPACFSIRPKNDECFSKTLKPSYPCCNGIKVVYTDKDGDWGVENGKWCGIGNGSSNTSDDSCFSVALGYKCCESCKVVYTDKDGEWGVEHNKWCGIKDSCTSTVEIVENPAQNATVVDVSNTDFEFQFLKMENKKKNMLYSPLSIEYALKMLEEGANNNTYDEIHKVIGNLELPKYESIDKNLSLANGLFIRDSYYERVIKEYISTIKEKYDADIVRDEFKDAQNVNGWIEDKTLGIIKNMLKDEVVRNPNLVMLIINALAIDMDWVSTFDCAKTYGETFNLDDGKEMTATMLFKKEVASKFISYYKGDDITALTMDLKDYNGTQFEFMAIMPKENLSAYVENVSKEQISEIDKKLISTSDEIDGANIKIPKFKFSYDLDLANDLQNLGIKDAFIDEKADFTKMAYINELYVSGALHKADIEFSEDGVKAAAVTVIEMMTKSAMPRQKNPVNVVIDRPFMFIIRDKNTKDIWFTGTVYEPNSWENDKEEYTRSNKIDLGIALE